MVEAAKRLRSLWRLLANAYAVLYAPWPLFGVTVALLTAVGVLAPLLQIRATAGLIDALAAGASDGAALLAAALPHLALLALALAAGALVSDTSLMPYLFQRHAERVVARTTEAVYRKALRLRLEVFEGTQYYDTLQRFLWIMQSSEVVANRLNRMQRLLSRLGQAAAVLWALGQVGWGPPLALLLGCGLIVHWRVRSAGQLIAITEAQTALRRRQEYWQRLLTQRPAAAEVRLFGLGGHLVGRWRG
jgi:ATP-binding cassette subfamily B protein